MVLINRSGFQFFDRSKVVACVALCIWFRMSKKEKAESKADSSEEEGQIVEEDEEAGAPPPPSKSYK